jgi:hypothetical protein
MYLAEGTGRNKKAVDDGLDAIARADLMRPLSRTELSMATFLAALKFELAPTTPTRQLAASYFERLRAMDGPNKSYDRNPLLQSLFEKDPALREIPPGMSTPTPPDPPIGALPPDTPILDDVL